MRLIQITKRPACSEHGGSDHPQPARAGTHRLIVSAAVAGLILLTASCSREAAKPISGVATVGEAVISEAALQKQLLARGGRPLVIANAIPATSSAFTAAWVRFVSTLSSLTRVPSTSAMTSEIFNLPLLPLLMCVVQSSRNAINGPPVPAVPGQQICRSGRSFAAGRIRR